MLVFFILKYHVQDWNWSECKRDEIILDNEDEEFNDLISSQNELTPLAQTSPQILPKDLGSMRSHSDNDSDNSIYKVPRCHGSNVEQQLDMQRLVTEEKFGEHVSGQEREFPDAREVQSVESLSLLRNMGYRMYNDIQPKLRLLWRERFCLIVRKEARNSLKVVQYSRPDTTRKRHFSICTGRQLVTTRKRELSIRKMHLIRDT